MTSDYVLGYVAMVSTVWWVQNRRYVSVGVLVYGEWWLIIEIREKKSWKSYVTIIYTVVPLLQVPFIPLCRCSKFLLSCVPLLQVPFILLYRSSVCRVCRFTGCSVAHHGQLLCSLRSEGSYGTDVSFSKKAETWMGDTSSPEGFPRWRSHCSMWEAFLIPRELGYNQWWWNDRVLHCGSIVRGLKKRTKCPSCQTMLTQNSDEMMTYEDETPTLNDGDRMKIVDMVNRGGLHLVHLSLIHAWNLYKYIQNDEPLFKKKMLASNAQKVFTAVYMQCLSESEITANIYNYKCASGCLFREKIE